MVNVRSIRAIILASVLLLSLGQSGCSVFSAIGGWFSSSYENTIAYFNAYYNAKKLFDEAEAEVLAARTTLKVKSTGTSTQPAGTGSTTKQKFTVVIDKCSNVLSFFPKSSVVDDALFLIGKSYFYQEEFVRAERKFTELLAKNPKGSLAFENQLWLLKTLQKLNKFEEANRVGQDLAIAAGDAGKDKIAGEALMILGDVAVAQKNTDVAIDQYAKSVAVSGDGAMQAAAQMKIGDLYFSLPEYEKAAAAYVDVLKYSPDDYTLYDSQLQAAIAYRRSEKFDQSIAVLRKMDSDYRLIDYRGTIRFELGRTFEKSGKLDEAIDMYRLVDTTNARTEAGARAAFELGKLYQFDSGKYADAKIAYSHALVGGSTELTQDATKRVAAFDSYFRLQQQFGTLDSILFILDIDSLWTKKDTLAGLGKIDSSFSMTKEKIDSSLGMAKKELPAESTRRGRTIASGLKDSSAAAAKKDSSLVLVKKDSVLARIDSVLTLAHADTLNSQRDSLQSLQKRDTSLTRQGSALRFIKRPKKDTLVASLGKLSYLLGELFYSELDVPDSTFFWLNQSLKLGLDSIQTPRALYVLAEVARANKEKKYGDEKDIYRTIVEKYPKSMYAEESRIALGYRPTMKIIDPAESVYAVAESLMFVGQYQRAVDSLGHIVHDYGESPLVPKSRYTMAWIYENHLSRFDSALSQYKTLAQKFVTTKYGVAAQKRIPPPEAPPRPATDSLKKALPDSAKAMMGVEAKKALADSTRKGQAVSVPKAPVDTTDERPIIKVPKPDSTKVKMDFNPVLRKPTSEVDTVKSEVKKEK
jgi:tetratricopeptide (TPR) repeat protein